MTRVVVTGAAGNLGVKAMAALDEADGISAVGIDTRFTTAIEPDLVVADLAMYDPTWVSAFRGADVVVHLAAEPSPAARWAAVQRANVDVSLNVLRAVEECGVGRIVFASSNWVLGGYRFGEELLTPATPPHPVNVYGYSKAMTERDCAALQARIGIEAVALRIGYCQVGDNLPGPQMAFGRWGQEMWLSNDDWCQAIAGACTAGFDGFEIVNLMSANTGMRWDLTDTERVLAYQARSHHTPHLTPRRRIEDRAARLRDTFARPLVDTTGRAAQW